MRHKQFFALIFVIPAMMFGCSPDPNRAVIAKAEQSVKQDLKDPDSAEFSDETVKGDPDTGTVCGRVNAKNSFGGYVGYRKFYFHPTTGKSFVEASDPADNKGLDLIWKFDCVSKGNTN